MNQQSKRNLTNKIISLAGIMVFVFFIAIYVSACSNYLKGNRTRRKLFGATYMTMNNEFYKVVNNQIRMQVEKNGDEMITLDPALDQKKQNEQIKQLVKRKVDIMRIQSSFPLMGRHLDPKDSVIRSVYQFTSVLYSSLS